MSAEPPPSPGRLTRPATLWLVALLLLALGHGLLQVRLGHTYPLREFDTLERAASARELLRTGQWSTRTLWTWELVGHEHQAPGRPWPVQVWSLGYPLLLAAGFAVFGSQHADAVTIALPLLAYAACVALVFLLALRLWGLRVAVLAGLLLLADRGLVHWSAVSHLESVYAGLTLACALLLLSRPRSLGAALGAGALLGFAYSLRPTALAFVPLFLLVALGEPPRLRWRALLAAWGGLLAVVLLSAVLTRALSPAPLPTVGTPLSYTRIMLLQGTPAAVSNTEGLPLTGPTWGEVLAAWPLILRKLLDWRDLYRGLSGWWPLLVLLLAPVGLILALGDRPSRRLALATVACFLLQMTGVILTAFTSLDRYASDFAPWLALFAALALATGYRRLPLPRPWHRRAYLALAAALIAGPLLVGLRSQVVLYRPSESPLLVRCVAGTYTPLQYRRDLIVASPVAADFAWRYPVRGIYTRGLRAEDYVELDRRLVPLDAVVLDQEAWGNRPAPDTLGRFQRRGDWLVPWRVLHGKPEYRHWFLYVPAGPPPAPSPPAALLPQPPTRSR